MICNFLLFYVDQRTPADVSICFGALAFFSSLAIYVIFVHIRI